MRKNVRKTQEKRKKITHKRELVAFFVFFWKSLRLLKTNPTHNVIIIGLKVGRPLSVDVCVT